eukprot:205512-Prymnesium_polylepis.1
MQIEDALSALEEAVSTSELTGAGIHQGVVSRIQQLHLRLEALDCRATRLSTLSCMTAGRETPAAEAPSAPEVSANRFESVSSEGSWQRDGPWMSHSSSSNAPPCNN